MKSAQIITANTIGNQCKMLEIKHFILRNPFVWGTKLEIIRCTSKAKLVYLNKHVKQMYFKNYVKCLNSDYNN